MDCLLVYMECMQLWQHLKSHPDTFLTRVLGMYRLVDGLQDYRFIIMKNAFPAGRTMHERYDLKVECVYLVVFDWYASNLCVHFLI
jgi:hypothetical protein